MAEVLLDHARRASAGSVESLVTTTFGVGYLGMSTVILLHWKVMDPRLIPIPILIGFAGLLGAFLAAWRFFGREILVIEDGALVVTWRLGRLAYNRSALLSEISDVQVVPYDRSALQDTLFGFGHPAVRVATKARSIRCCVACGEGRAQELAARIRQAREGS